MDGHVPDNQPTRPTDDERPEQPVDEYQAASQATAGDEYEEYERHAKPYRRGHAVRTALIILVAVVVLAGIGFGAYWLFLRKGSTSTTDTNQSNSQQQAEEKPHITQTTKHHASTNFTLEFDYPEDWEITETSGSGRLVAQSPEMNLKQANGQTVPGRVVLTIRNKQQPLPEFDKGNAVAAQESEKINYTKPSSVQRGSTYLSFLRYASSTASKGIDGAYITGDTGYQAGQAIPVADFTPVDPVISVTFTAGDKAFTLDSSLWGDATFAQPIKAMLQSLTIT